MYLLCICVGKINEKIVDFHGILYVYINATYTYTHVNMYLCMLQVYSDKRSNND